MSQVSVTSVMSFERLRQMRSRQGIVPETGVDFVAATVSHVLGSIIIS